MASKANETILQETTELIITVMPESGFVVSVKVKPEGATYASEKDVAAVSNLAQLLGFIRGSYFGGDGDHHFEVYAPE